MVMMMMKALKKFVLRPISDALGVISVVVIISILLIGLFSVLLALLINPRSWMKL